VAALTPLSVDGMIVAASTTLLADSRSGCRGGPLPWALLVIGSVASLAANVAVAEPTLMARIIAAWPSFALIGSYELLMRQVRRAAVGPSPGRDAAEFANYGGVPVAAPSSGPKAVGLVSGGDVRRQAWEWAVANAGTDGALPSGKVIADRYGRHERWGRVGARGEKRWCCGRVRRLMLHVSLAGGARRGPSSWRTLMLAPLRDARREPARQACIGSQRVVAA